MAESIHRKSSRRSSIQRHKQHYLLLGPYLRNEKRSTNLTIKPSNISIGKHLREHSSKRGPLIRSLTSTRQVERITDEHSKLGSLLRSSQRKELRDLETSLTLSTRVKIGVILDGRDLCLRMLEEDRVGSLGRQSARVFRVILVDAKGAGDRYEYEYNRPGTRTTRLSRVNVP